MKRIVQLFDARGLKLWILFLTFCLNLVLTFFLFTGIGVWMNQQGGWVEGVDLLLMLGVFLISGLLGLGVTLLAKDRRGPSYGVLGALGAFIMVIAMMFQVGLLAIIVGLTALLGGYNGGMIGERILIGRKSG